MIKLQRGINRIRDRFLLYYFIQYLLIMRAGCIQLIGESAAQLPYVLSFVYALEFIAEFNLEIIIEKNILMWPKKFQNGNNIPLC